MPDPATSTKPPSPARADRRRAPETAQRILDAAEALFSLRGYYGVSLRDIAGAAKVQVALTHYHFGSKEDLFGAVINRRAEENARGILDGLREARRTTGSRSQRRDALIRGFIAPIVDKTMRGGAGWKNYIRLLALVANMPQEEEFVSPFRQNFDPVTRAFIRELKELHPEMGDDNADLGFFFFQAMTTHILVESGLLDRQSGGRLSSGDLDSMVDRMVAFVSAGLTGLGAIQD